MLRILLVLLSLFCAQVLLAQTDIALDNAVRRLNGIEKAVIYEDVNNALTPAEVLQFPADSFRIIEHENLDFTHSTWWVKMKVSNPTDSTVRYLLETGRPITNLTYLYTVKDGKVVRLQQSGDAVPFDQKEVHNRKTLFPVTLQPGEERNYLMQVWSDGELLVVPLFFWREYDLDEYIYYEQMWLGVYYGMLLFVTIIYLFFAIALREKSFNYYVLYIVSIAGLQFALDGFFHQFVFPNFLWGADHSVFFFAGLTEIFALIYAREFVKARTREPKLYNLFNIVIAICIIPTVTGVLPGVFYDFTFLSINITGLLASLFIPIAIYWMKARGHQISNYFAIAFTLLIIGAILFIMRNVAILEANLLTEHLFKIFSLLEVILLSISMANRYREMQREKAEAQKETLIQLEEKSRMQQEMNVRLERTVDERTRQLKEQKEELATVNKGMVDSIRYAHRIQRAILPSDDEVNAVFPNSFILYMPRDIVSGDFYYVAQMVHADTPTTSFAAADCTGHGVPGAFVSIVGHNYLKLGQTQGHVKTPAEALNFLNAGIMETFQQEVDEQAFRDGMDIAYCAVEHQTGLLHFAGAKNPVNIIRKADIPTDAEPCMVKDGYAMYEIKGDKRAIGHQPRAKKAHFTPHQFQLLEGDTIYVYSDGFQDQFGGKTGKKFMTKRFKSLLLSIQNIPIREQEQKLRETYHRWVSVNGEDKQFEQLDDILVMGFQYVKSAQ